MSSGGPAVPAAAVAATQVVPCLLSSPAWWHTLLLHGFDALSVPHAWSSSFMTHVFMAEMHGSLHLAAAGISSFLCWELASDAHVRQLNPRRQNAAESGVAVPPAGGAPRARRRRAGFDANRP